MTEEQSSLARAGADSIFSYVQRTAEESNEGVCWQTLDYHNNSQYDVSVFNGVAGIALFLGDYFWLFKEDRARVLALDGLRWCRQGERKGFTRGLFLGRVGVGMGWLRLAKVTGESNLLEHCIEPANYILNHEPGPVTDILGGAAGNGLFLIRLWEATGEERYLEGASRNASWLREVADRTEGCSWSMGLGERPWHSLGFAHGLAGIAYFLTVLHGVTDKALWAELARDAIGTLTSQAFPDRGGLNWPVTLNTPDMGPCQWCHGAAGIGLTYVRAYEVFGDSGYLETARAAGETTFARGDIRKNPSQCHGLAGNAELFIELYRVSEDPLWLERAYDFALRAFSYREMAPEGDRWQADDPECYSTDFMCGASGTGHFFLRLSAPEALRMPML